MAIRERSKGQTTIYKTLETKGRAIRTQLKPGD